MGLFAFQSNKTPRKQPVSKKRSSSKSKASVRIVTSLYFFVLFLITGGIVLLANGNITVGGVPMPIIMNFLGDEQARSAYFAGNGQALHDRLEVMGVEGQMKDFYRRQIPDEVKLDQHIHQILYDRTGFVGAAYRLTPQKELVLKE